MEKTRYRSLMIDSGRWDRLALRPDDIVISTPPKCGTTWMQTCCALLLFRTPDLPAPMAELSPWVDMIVTPADELAATLDAQQHRRFLKSHTPLDGIPWSADVTYICVGRDPRDVALSWDSHMENLDIGKVMTARIAAGELDDLDDLQLPTPPPEDPLERFRLWLDVTPEDAMNISGLEALARHMRSFWDRREEPNVHLFHYADMKADLAGEMRRLAGILGVDEPDDALVEAATFEQMKARAEVFAPNTTQDIWVDTTRFFDKARSGGWRDVIPAADLDRYRERIAALAPPDLVGWLER